MLVPQFDRPALAKRLAALAERGVYLGTSSWKYAGWMGQLYDESRYVYRGRFSEARFNRLCLSEYAEVFKTVGVDAAYYQYPTRSQLSEWAAAVPEDFRFSLKVTDHITLKRFPQLPRFGDRAGRDNPDFLNAEAFVDRFLGPLEVLGEKVGVIMFEFTRFHAVDFSRGRDFLAALDAFLSKLPAGWRYAVELRNSNFLQPEYFELLARHGVAHLLNSWEAMPPIGEQLAMPGVITQPEFAAARLLLKPGRAYADAVSRFSPYQEIRDPYPQARTAAADLVRRTVDEAKPRKSFIYVNNRLEGSALRTIEAIVAASAA